jgi:mannose-6-phosphate isomerase-like protein (cupin superfamily)
MKNQDAKRPMKDATGVRLAQRIREMRTARGLTLQEVSDSAKLAEALDVPIGEFFEVDGQETTIFFPKESRKRSPGRRSSMSYTYELLTPSRGRRQMQSMLVSVDGKTYKFALQDHPGEQFVFLLEGEMDYIVGDKQYSMQPEDCLYFDGRVSHGPKLNANQRARYLVVFTER